VVATGPHRVVGPTQVVEAALLQVNNSFITVQQVLHPIRHKLQALAAGGGNVPQFQRAALALIDEETGNQVERTLLLVEAEKRLTEEQTRAINEEVNKIYRRALAQCGGSKTAFLQRLGQEGTDLETWHKDLWSAMAIQVYGHQQFASKLHVTRRMMWKYYRANPEKFRTEDRVQMQIIAVPFEGFLPTGRAGTQSDRREAVKKAERRMKEALAALAGGTDFGDVALKYSRGPMASAGGVWPTMARGSFRAEAVEKAAFAQQAGQVSELIATSEALYVVKTLARRRGEKLAFEKVQGQIEQDLRRQQFDRTRREYLAQLRSKATIVGAEGFRRVALSTAVRTYLGLP
jgi:parvulin-like peptidyl-prolyl isomerase